jgi:hypothetical protein
LTLPRIDDDRIVIFQVHGSSADSSLCLVRPGHDTFKDIGQPGQWVDLIQLRGLDQRRDDSPVVTAAVRAGDMGVRRASPALAALTIPIPSWRDGEVPRLRHGDVIDADETQSVRAFGQETEVMQLQTEEARRLAGPPADV